MGVTIQLMNDIVSNGQTEEMSRPPRHRERSVIAVLSMILGITLEWHAQADTNLPLELREALDDTNLVWTTSNTIDPCWRLQFSETHDGVDAAECGLQAGVVGALSSIATSVLGPGELSFWG